jgi:hypothetical protein
MAVTRLAAHDNIWTRLKIPKSSFFVSNLPPDIEPWTQLTGWEITMRTNRNGPAIGYFDNGSMFGGTGMQGTYKYHVTFLNENTGTRGNPNPTAYEIPYNNRTGNRLTSIPLPVDDQVTHREIWRTVGNGSVHFRVAKIPVSDPNTWDDHIADVQDMHDLEDTEAMESLELPYDNIKPHHTVEDCAGPHVGRVWWTGDTERQQRGRVYYSGLSRLEAMVGFVEVSSDSDPMQKVVVHDGSLYCCSRSHWWEILNVEEPFIARKVFGAPGTLYPHSVLSTPMGIIYLADDGIRVLQGAESSLLYFEAIGTLFRGEPAIGLSAFPTPGGRIKAVYWRDEYIITDNSKTLACNLRTGAWRDIGVSLGAMFGELDTGLLTVGRLGIVYDWEHPQIVTDDGGPIPFQVEIPSTIADAGQEQTVAQRLYLDINTNGQVLYATTYGHDQRIAFGDGAIAFSTTQRETVEIALAAIVGVAYVNIAAVSGTTEEIILYGVEFDAHVPRPAQAA